MAICNVRSNFIYLHLRVYNLRNPCEVGNQSKYLTIQNEYHLWCNIILDLQWLSFIYPTGSFWNTSCSEGKFISWEKMDILGSLHFSDRLFLLEGRASDVFFVFFFTDINTFSLSWRYVHAHRFGVIVDGIDVHRLPLDDILWFILRIPYLLSQSFCH